MNIPEVLELADELIFTHTGKHLTNIQKSILQGTLNHKNYPEISQATTFSESHVKNIGAELFNLLSDALGKKVTKKKL